MLPGAKMFRRSEREDSRELPGARRITARLTPSAVFPRARAVATDSDGTDDEQHLA